MTSTPPSSAGSSASHHSAAPATQEGGRNDATPNTSNPAAAAPPDPTAKPPSVDDQTPLDSNPAGLGRPDPVPSEPVDLEQLLDEASPATNQSNAPSGPAGGPTGGDKPPPDAGTPRAIPQPKGEAYLSWLYAPTPSAFFFALRTSLAACLALGFSLWMELDDPSWAPLTVWSVAQISRGESLSKAKWRIVGTLVGCCAGIAIMAAIPQASWMYFPAIAVWLGICSFMATFISNFRAYGCVLAGYTCSVIGTGAAPDANHVFMIAMSRGSYIIIGVICEASVAFVFSPNQMRQARIRLRQLLQKALDMTATTLGQILTKGTNAQATARMQFGTMLRINNDIEFTEVEMGPHGHEADHARAALAAISVLLARGFGLVNQLEELVQNPDCHTLIEEILSFLKTLPECLPDPALIPELLAELQHLRDICRQYAAPHRLTSHGGAAPDELSAHHVAHLTAKDKADIVASALDERVMFVALGELLSDLERAIIEYNASTHIIRGDHFRFQPITHRDPRLALNNGLRSGSIILLTGLVYEVTAWPQGLKCIGIASLICGLNSINENPANATLGWLKGTIGAITAAWFLVFIFMPMVDVYEPLIVILVGGMMVGGLAKANPATRPAGAAYSLLFPTMLGLQNHHVMQEMQYFNINLGIGLASLMTVIVYRTILPFNAAQERFRLRRAMLRELRQLANPAANPSIARWVGNCMDRFSCILRHAGSTPDDRIEQFIEGTLGTLTMGMAVIKLRGLMDRDYLPESARRPIILVLHYVEFPAKHYMQAAQTTDSAIRRLRELDTSDHDTVSRLELTRAIAYLMVIAHNLKHCPNFLNPTRPFKGEGTALKTSPAGGHAAISPT
ncbi:FUSC family protein [Formicincola oecophyllae]|uniref:FUSC family protein n=1 Tax=Formicincola oecophyllae TaxID=2558361 RepID=A0A4Y6U7K2_9PROT|nr:FUSC family protein [Formicincola oecophyllae]QDH12990.1 FUSC family protein [Formicincola oecophyllae]